MTPLPAEQLSLLCFDELQALIQQLDHLLICPDADPTSLFRDWFAESLFREPMDTRAEASYAAHWTIEGISGEKTVTEAEWLVCTDPAPMWDYHFEKSSKRK